MEIFENISIALNEIVKKIKSFIDLIINAITKKDKWTLFIYFNGQLIKKIKVDENFKPMENFYYITVKGFKHMFGKRKVSLLFQYDKYKMTNNDKKQVHIEVKINEGSDV